MKEYALNGKQLKAQTEIGDLGNHAIIFVVVAVIIAVGAYMLTSIGSTGAFGANSVANQTLTFGQTALKTIGTWWLLILGAILIAVIVLLLIKGLGAATGGGRAV